MERLTPLDIERAQLRTRMRGYDRAQVDLLLQRCSREIEHLLGENKRLQGYADSALTELEQLRSHESALKDALVLAQKAADETRANAHKEAELILESARRAETTAKQEAEQQVVELRWEVESLKRERDNLRFRIRAVIEEHLRLLDSDALNDPLESSQVSLEVRDAVGS